MISGRMRTGKSLWSGAKTMIPFQGRVIYDSILEVEPGVVVSTAAQTLNQVHQDAKRDGNLIRRLPSDVPPPNAERWRGVVQTLVSLREKEEIANSEEFLRQALNAPDVHILSERDLFVLDKMLKQPHRSEKDWERIKVFCWMRTFLPLSLRAQT